MGAGQAGELVCGGPSRIAGVTGHDAQMCTSKQYVRVANMGLKPKKKKKNMKECTNTKRHTFKSVLFK